MNKGDACMTSLRPRGLRGDDRAFSRGSRQKGGGAGVDRPLTMPSRARPARYVQRAGGVAPRTSAGRRIDFKRRRLRPAFSKGFWGVAGRRACSKPRIVTRGRARFALPTPLHESGTWFLGPLKGRAGGGSWGPWSRGVHAAPPMDLPGVLRRGVWGIDQGGNRDDGVFGRLICALPQASMSTMFSIRTGGETDRGSGPD